MSIRNSSLHQAIKAGDSRAVNALLAEGADVNATNEAGQIPLILAIVAAQHQLVRRLLMAGANPLLRDNTGLTAIDWAERKGETELAQSLTKQSQSQSRDSSSDATGLPVREQKTPRPSVEDAPRTPLSSDEKTRRFIAGLKQRLDEKTSREITSSPPGSTETKQQPDLLKIILENAAREDSVREKPIEGLPIVSEQPWRKETTSKRPVEALPVVPVKASGQETTSGTPIETLPIVSETGSRKETTTEKPIEALPIVSEKPARIETITEKPVETLPIVSEKPSRKETTTEKPIEALPKVSEKPARKEATTEKPIETLPIVSEKPSLKETTTKKAIEALPAGPEKAAREQSTSTRWSEIPPAAHEKPAREKSTRQRHRETLYPMLERVAPEVVTNVATATTEPPSAFSSASQLQKSTRSSSKRKRCPQCGAVYNSELLAYCSYDAVALVDADLPIVTRTLPESSAFLWIMVVIVLVLGTLAGIFVTSSLLRSQESDTQTVVSSQPPPSQKGIPVAGRQLAGKELSLLEAEVPGNTVHQPVTVTVRVRIDRAGRVYWATSEEGDEALRDAALAAAKKSTFSVEKLRGRAAEGTITYRFK